MNFSGWKTYVFGGLGIVVGLCGTLGFLTQEQVVSMLAILAGAGGMALRGAVKTIEKKADAIQVEQQVVQSQVRSFMSPGRESPRAPFVPSQRREHDK